MAVRRRRFRKALSAILRAAPGDFESTPGDFEAAPGDFESSSRRFREQAPGDFESSSRRFREQLPAISRAAPGDFAMSRRFRTSPFCEEEASFESQQEYIRMLGFSSEI